MIKYDTKFNVLEELDNFRQIITLEPLERGYGHTLGNGLRRVMLGYLYGAAITRLRVNDVSHEFSPLKGVHEDVVELIQNLKRVDFKMTMPDKKKVGIVTLDAIGEASGEKEILAGDLKCPPEIEVVNKDFHIATLSGKKSKLTLELTVEYGQGYRLPDEREKKPVGVILIDANFSPVILVSFKVESTRIGQITDLDRLEMDITTDGSITPKQAVQKASAILAEYYQLLAGDTEVYQDEGAESDQAKEKAGTKKPPEPEIYLEELNLPTRVLNTLKKADYETVADLQEVGEEKLRKVKNIGPKTVDLLLKKIDDLKK